MDFVTNGEATAEGQRVIAYMKAQLLEAEAAGGVVAINALAGPVTHFYANVLCLRAMTEAEWLKSYPNAAAAMHSNLIALDEAKAKAEAATAEKTAISESLDEVKAALAVALQRIADLEAAQKPAEEPAAEPEPEADAAPVESKKSRKAAKTEPEPEAVEVDAETEA